MIRSAATSLLRLSRSSAAAPSVLVNRTFPSFSTNEATFDNMKFDKVSKEDNGEFAEFSVIYTNRALNLMSVPFQKVMRDLNDLLKTTYNAEKVAIIPGSGTFGMESVARQFATGEHVMVIRNGWFSFRWTEIFEMGSIPKSHTVLKAQPVGASSENSQYAPHPIADVVEKIRAEKPAVLFAAHVETSTGMMLPNDYIREAAKAVHEVGGLFVLDCIASGTVWADMKDLGVDVVISAPQKGWSGPCCCALVMMSEAAVAKMETTKETSFSMSLKKWCGIMGAYEGGAFGYHTTLPTDALRDFHNVTVEMVEAGMDKLKDAQIELGEKARSAVDSRGLVSVAAPGFGAPGILVYYSPPGNENPAMVKKFKDQGLQIAAGVPWRLDEPEGLKTFRIGLLGLDKLSNVQETVDTFTKSLDGVIAA